MQRSTLVGLVAVIAVVAVIASLSIAAAPKQYQFTGNVTEVDAKAGMMAVDKGGEIWEFSTAGLKDLKAKKGDKVTVFYQMVAKRVEMK